MLQRIDHTAVTVSDMERSMKFYTEVLGFVAHQTIDLPGLHIEYLKLGDSLLELFAVKDAAGDPRRQIGQVGFQHLCLLSDDLEGDAARLKDKGVNFTTQPQAAEGVKKLAFFEDPDGVNIELVER
jgi:lactoylglutathione lyase